MSWESIGESEYPCPCGRGTFTVETEMDDWNRMRHYYVMNCLECKGKYVYSEKQKGYKPGHTRDEGWIPKD